MTAKEILQDMALLLRVARCAKSPDEITSFLDGHKSRIIDLIKTADSFAAQIKLGVSSMDYKVETVDLGTWYNSNEMSVDVKEANARGREVLCTEALGLSTRVATTNSLRVREWVVKPRVFVGLFDS